ncbi:MAG: hypothetical protein Q7S92_06765 [Candidatus Diapherotrites archaeon]|nr:hypothetical protein [Candidatus Diapherotrites archaeon]
MPNLTLVISEELQQKMRKHSDIRWSEVARQAIAKRLADLEIMNKIAEKSKLTEKDINELDHLIKKEALRELKQNEHRSRR